MLIDLLRPRALVSHALLAATVVTCVLLGQWQLERLDRVRANNDRLETRLADDPVDLGALDTTIDDAAWEFRRVTATGVFRPEEEVLQRNRSLQGRQGFHVLTPLELADGDVVLVRRGWVPAELDDPPVAEAAPPPGTVTVTGLLERPVAQPRWGARDPDDGRLQRVFHTDTDRLDRQVDGELFPMILRSEPPAAGERDPRELPVAVDRPVLDENNHLSYAVQWHSFAVIALVTYVAWWRTRLRRRTEEHEPTARQTAGVAGGA